jgi:hypothetical protein
MNWIAGALDDVKNIENWFIVDIGFSSSQKSCGIVTVQNNGKFTKTVHYGEMIHKFKEFVKNIEEDKDIGLVIEAPLSIAFSNSPDKANNGNPVAREAIELENKEDKETKTKTRYWYVGAGAAVTLSALHFLNEIKGVLNKKKIYLYEGLLSFKDINKQSHVADALDLYNAIKELAEQPLNNLSILNECQKNVEMKFIGDYLNIKLKDGRIPSVIKVAKNNYSDPRYSFHVYPYPEKENIK